jgi:catechol 2,3-dioxygenase-like lactoylglutathione lyase family enzyme
MKLELLPIPVTDVDRAKAFYADALGFRVDLDVRPADGVRVVQVTPPGSACSIGFGTGLPVYSAPPGSVRGLHLVVSGIDQARGELVGRGVEVGPVTDVGAACSTRGSPTPTATASPCSRCRGAPATPSDQTPTAAACPAASATPSPRGRFSERAEH